MGWKKTITIWVAVCTAVVRFGIVALQLVNDLKDVIRDGCQGGATPR